MVEPIASEIPVRIDARAHMGRKVKGLSAAFAPLATIALCFASSPALAHIVSGAQGGLASGLAHPLTGPDHFLAMFAVGLWGAQMGGRRVWSLAVAFPLIMVLGGVLAMLGVVLPDIEIGIALSIVALGTAIALMWRPPEWTALALIAAFAICHGYAHGAELPRSADPAEYATGFVLATGVIHVFGIGVGQGLMKPRKGEFTRILGGAIALAGLYFFVAAVL
jgi:urease accessory protein